MLQTISHYRVVEPLGSGGAGYVWKAEDLKLKRTVAIKCLQPGFAQGGQAIEQLQSEAQMAAALNHPNIATVYEVVESSDQFYLVMEFVEGETLKSRIERGPLDINASLDVATQVADALRAAHARGLIHCDIKSSNIMIAPDGQAKVLDFGLAKIADSTRQGASRGVLGTGYRADGLGTSIERESFQASEVISGTPGFMSPEQVRGEGLDQRTDIFSLGVVLYEMLTARMPFHGDGRREVFHSVLNDEPASLGAFCDDAPLELERIVRRALAKRRDERYGSAEDLLRDLRALKRRHENREDFEARCVTSTRSGRAEENESFADRDRLSTLRGVAWRHRRSFMLVGALAALMAVYDIASFHPRGAEWTRASGLLAVAAVCALSYVTARQRPFEGFNAIPAGAAFRGLLPFQEADRDRFYGREPEAAALFEMIRHIDFRFGVLFGESGCGKTSLLRAGLLPKLWEAGYLPIYCRSYKDPLAAALEECHQRSHLAPKDGESPVDYLKRVARQSGATLLIVCDQFEEFFISHRLKEEREPFVSFIQTCHASRELPGKFLMSMRSDFLYLISSELGGRVTEPLISSRLYHLRNFDEAQGAEIIEKSARRAGLPLEEGLSRQVARDLTSGGVVSASELQIVGEQLQRKRIYTFQAYRQAGSKEQLVHIYLEDVIRAAPDIEGARLLLRCLISDENTKLTLPLAEIVSRTQRGRATVERILRLFVRSRLIREIQDEEPWRYELVHEYLIDKINQTTGRVMDATQRANRLLRQYVSNYSLDKRTRIPISKLWFIRRYSDGARGARERELFTKSVRLGLVKATALVTLLAAAAVAAAAGLSVTEEWESVRLSDGHTAAVRQAVFSPDGKLLASCGEDKKVIIWDFARRERLATLTDHEGIVSAVAFSPDGRWLATASYDKSIIVWNAARLEKAFVLRGHTEGVFSLGFSPDGRFLVSVGRETISWRVPSFEKVFVAPDSTSGNLTFLPHSSKFSFANDVDEITFWDAETGKPERRKIAGVIQGYVATSPDGKMRMSVDGVGVVQFVDTWRGKILRTVEAHKDNGRWVTFSPDGKLAASASENVILWDARTQTKIATLEHDSLVWNVAFSPDGRWLVSTHADGAILVWDVAERQRVANLNEHSGAVYSVAYSPDGKRIASTGEDASVIIWNAETGQKEAVLIGNRSKAIGVAFLPDGERVISCGFLEPLILFDIARGEALRSFVSPNSQLPGNNAFAVSPDGRQLVSPQGVYDISDARMICNFAEKFKAGEKTEEWLRGSSSIYGMGFSKDGRLFACSTAVDGHIGLLDTTTWEIVAYARAPDSGFISLSFSPDGKLLATGDDDGKVELWSVSPLQREAIIGRHAARVKAVAFSPDGRQIVSSSDDKTIALWNVASRSLATRLGTHSSPVRSVAFSPDGRHIVSGEHNKSVRIHTRHRVLWGFRLD